MHRLPKQLSAKLIGALGGASLLLASCGGGGGSASSGSPAPTPPPASRSFSDPAAEALSATEVDRIVGLAVAEAQARNLPAVIAVTDRVGNVLSVYKMTGAPDTAHIPEAPDGSKRDVQGLDVPAAGAAIAKAITGAYLSSSGNAFSTRTASKIVQEHYPPAPASANLPGGPLFGVQFSQLPCSDLNTRLSDPRYPALADAMIGPKRSPLGLAADPGGFPLYKNGVVVGGIGVMADGTYGLDADSSDVDAEAANGEEYVALAGTRGFEAPVSIRADRISAGVFLSYSDADYTALRTSAAASLSGAGAPQPVIGYFTGTTLAGTAYGATASGYRHATTSEFNNPDAVVLTDGSGNARFPLRGGTDAADVAQPLTQTEVTALLEEAFKVMTKARAQIRQPLDSRAQVTISMVDTRGQVLGLVRSPDAPIFGTDVSLQKARTAAFFSNSRAASDLLAFNSGIASNTSDVSGTVAAMRAFMADSAALTGTVAYSARAIGNLARPFFPDGEQGRPNGPLSRPALQFNPFSTGLQSALVLGNLAGHLGFVTGASATDTPQRCTFLPDVAPGQNRLANGIQIFPGGVPVYRGNTLVGAIGVSGDGVTQDDMIAFLGANNGGQRTTDIRNAPSAIRADKQAPMGINLLYVQCPNAPFLGSNENLQCPGTL